MNFQHACKFCGEPRGQSLFLWTSDELWAKMGLKPNDFVCAHCTIDKLSEIASYVYVIPGNGTHKIKAANNSTIIMK